MLTSAGPDFEPARDLPGVAVFLRRARPPPRASRTSTTPTARATRCMSARAGRASTSTCCPTSGATPDVLLLAPGRGRDRRAARRSRSRPRWWARAPRAGCARSTRDGARHARRLARSRAATSRACTCSSCRSTTCPTPTARARDLLRYVPDGRAHARAGEGLHAPHAPGHARGARAAAPRGRSRPAPATCSRPRSCVRYQETGDPLEAAAFAACAASCAVEGVGASTPGRPRRGRAAPGAAPAPVEDGEWEE